MGQPKHQRLLLGLAHAHAGELPGYQPAVIVLEHGADADGAALPVDLVVDQLDVPLGAEAARRHHVDRDLVEIAALAGGVRDRVQRAQHDFLVGIEARIDRIDRDQRGQDRRRGACRDEIADRDLDPADPAIDRRPHLGVVEIEFGRLQRGLGGLDVGDCLAVGVVALVEIALGHDVVADQLRAALDFARGEHDAGLGGLELRLGAIDLGGVGRRVDLEQDVAGLHQRALGEVGRKDRTRHPRPELDTVDGFEPAGEVIEQCGRPRLDHGNGYRDRRLGSRGSRGRLCGMKIVAGRDRTSHREGAKDYDTADDTSEAAGTGILG